MHNYNKMYTTKYRPTNLSEFIGNKGVIQPFIRWLLEWDVNNKKAKCALVSGVNGIGKSLLVELILKKHDYNIIDLTIGDDRDKETITETIAPLLKTKRTFNGQENVLVVSEVDGGGDYGFIATLTECIKETCIPIICICDDRYSQNIKPILNYCYDIKLVKSSFDDIYRLIYKVVTTEQIRISKQAIDKLYEESNGDIRFILNTLQLGVKNGSTSKNIQSSNIFDTTGKLFSMDLNIDDKLRYYWMSPDIHTLMVHENYIHNTLSNRDDVKRLENIAYSADSLSDADLIETVFDFSLSSYVAMNTIKATSKCNKKSMIKFPQFMGRVSTMNKNKKSKLDYSTIKLVGDKFVATASNTIADGTLAKCKKVKTTTAVKKTRTKA
jgi:replication factor C subunit 1